MIQRIADLFCRKKFSGRATHEALFWIERLNNVKPFSKELAKMRQRSVVDIWRKLRAVYLSDYWNNLPRRKDDFEKGRAKEQISWLLRQAGDFK